jgi:predicted GIY-YIG superfamily endonuclease
VIRNGVPVPAPRRDDLDDTEEIWLYRWYDQDGNLLYVGLTNNPERRVNGHRSRAEWWPWAYRMEVNPEPIVGRGRAEQAEGAVILEERPIFNCDWSPLSRSVAEHYMEIVPPYEPDLPDFPPDLKPGQVWLTREEWAEIDSRLTLGRVSKAIQMRVILRDAVTQYLASDKATQ